MTPPLIFDAHLDLAMNAMEWNRDLTQSIEAIRRREAPLRDKPDRGLGTVCLPEMRRGRVGICVATLIARVEHDAYSPVSGWASPAQAWAQTQGQLAWYRAMEASGEMTSIRDAAGLERHLRTWAEAEPSPTGPDQTRDVAALVTVETPAESAADKLPIGFILSLEGADSIVTLKQFERAYELGLRALGPAHYGPGIYANGTNASGGFNVRGRELLGEMDRLGLILDVSHLCDDCFWEAVDLYRGSMWASHSNCRALVPHSRQLTDDQLRVLMARDAVIGSALDAWMLVPDWERGGMTPEAAGLRLDTFVQHLDHVCQIAGNTRHAGIGSDLDGAFGREQTPLDVETIADLGQIPDLLKRRGYGDEDVQRIMSGNFLRVLRRGLR